MSRIVAGAPSRHRSILDTKSVPAKQPRARAWIEHLWEQRRGRLSQQVLSEYYVAVARKLRPGLPPEEAQAEIRDLMAWRPVSVDSPMLEDAWSLERRLSLHFRDALIVAAARSVGSRYLLSEDLQAGQDLDGVLVVDPFRTRPDELPGA